MESKIQFPGWPSRDLVSPLPEGVEPVQYVEPTNEEVVEEQVEEQTEEQTEENG
jgi:hypothetical protein